MKSAANHRISVANMVLSFGTVEKCECFLVRSVGTVERCECFFGTGTATDLWQMSDHKNGSLENIGP